MKKLNIKYYLAIYQLQTYSINKKLKLTTINQNKKNKNNYMHNIIKAEQTNLLL